jgi:hypothetical protein
MEVTVQLNKRSRKYVLNVLKLSCLQSVSKNTINLYNPNHLKYRFDYCGGVKLNQGHCQDLDSIHRNRLAQCECNKPDIARYITLRKCLK